MEEAHKTASFPPLFHLFLYTFSHSFVCGFSPSCVGVFPCVVAGKKS